MTGRNEHEGGRGRMAGGHRRTQVDGGQTASRRRADGGQTREDTGGPRADGGPRVDVGRRLHSCMADSPGRDNKVDQTAELWDVPIPGLMIPGPSDNLRGSC